MGLSSQDPSRTVCPSRVTIAAMSSTCPSSIASASVGAFAYPQTAIANCPVEVTCFVTTPLTVIVHVMLDPFSIWASTEV